MQLLPELRSGVVVHGGRCVCVHVYTNSEERMLGAVIKWKLPGSLPELQWNQVNDIFLLLIPTLHISLENNGLGFFSGGVRTG